MGGTLTHHLGETDNSCASRVMTASDNSEPEQNLEACHCGFLEKKVKARRTASLPLVELWCKGTLRRFTSKGPMMQHPPCLYHPLERDPAHTSLTIARADSSHLSRAEIEHSWYWVEQALLHAVRGDEHGARAASVQQDGDAG